MRQIDPSIELYIKKLRQLPASFTSGMDPKQIEKILKEEEEDLATPARSLDWSIPVTFFRILGF